EVDVPLEVVIFPPIGLVGAHHLLVQSLDLWRQQPVQAEAAPLVLGERRALVQDRAVEEIDATGAVGGNRCPGSLERGHRRVPFFLWVQFLTIRVLRPRTAPGAGRSGSAASGKKVSM